MVIIIRCRHMQRDHVGLFQQIFFFDVNAFFFKFRIMERIISNDLGTESLVNSNCRTTDSARSHYANCHFAKFFSDERCPTIILLGHSFAEQILVAQKLQKLRNGKFGNGAWRICRNICHGNAVLLCVIEINVVNANVSHGKYLDVCI